MDDKRFDQMTRLIGGGASRRSIFKGLLGLGGAAVVGSELSADDVDARTRTRPGATTTPVPPPACPLPGKMCNGTCCASGNCVNGVCCAAGQKICGASCCASTDVCAGNTCCNPTTHDACGDQCCPKLPPPGEEFSGQTSTCARDGGLDYCCQTGFVCNLECCDSKYQCCDRECCPDDYVCLVRVYGAEGVAPPMKEEFCCPEGQTCDHTCCDGTCYDPNGGAFPADNGGLHPEWSCCPAGGEVCEGYGETICCASGTKCCVRSGEPICIDDEACCDDNDCSLGRCDRCDTTDPINSQCIDDDALCPGNCQVCEAGQCVADDSLCKGCATCPPSGSCVVNDSECDPCQTCTLDEGNLTNGTCNDDCDPRVPQCCIDGNGDEYCAAKDAQCCVRDGDCPPDHCTAGGDFVDVICMNGVCTEMPIDCDDRNACTIDTCNDDPDNGAVGCVYTPVACDDRIACTDDSCDTATGCVYTPNNANCPTCHACAPDDEDADSDGCAFDCRVGTGCCGDCGTCVTQGANAGQCIPNTQVNCGTCKTCQANATNGYTCTITAGAICGECLNCSVTGTCTVAATPGGPHPSCEAGEVCCPQTGGGLQCEQGPFCGCDVPGDCDDKNPCTSDLCFNGRCDHDNLTDGEAPDPATGWCCDGTHYPTGECCENSDCDEDAPYCSNNQCVQCLDATQCPDDTDPCTQRTCISNVCGFAPVPNSPAISCDDGLYCTVNDVCVNGVCLGTPRDCSDGKTCTVDTCDDAQNICVHRPDDDACDGLPDDVCWICRPAATGANASTGCVFDCTMNAETCCPGASVCNTTTGQCVACNVADDCPDDADPCTQRTCISNVCGFAPVPNSPAISCDDGLYCTVNDVCVNGVCLGTPRDCSDGKTCTVDTCDDAQNICVHRPDDDACDGLPDDVCWICRPAATGANASTGCLFDCTMNAETCCPGASVCNTTTGQCVACNVADDCPDDADPCTQRTCISNVCGFAPVPNSPAISCDDGLYCTVNDVCVNGVCLGTPRDCSDGKTCTVDTCDDAQNICVHRPDDDACDGLPDDVCWICRPAATGANASTGCLFDCTMNAETCCPGSSVCDTSTGRCVGCLTAADCDDRDICTIDTCDTTTNTCVHTPTVPAACNDGNPCTRDTCSNNTCRHDPLTANTPCDFPGGGTNDGICCDGQCLANNTVANCGTCGTQCNDSNACTTDTCVAGGPSGFQCAFPAIPCDDGNPCTTSTCNTSTGACTHTPVASGAACIGQSGVCCTTGAGGALQCQAGSTCGCTTDADCANDPSGDGPCLQCNVSTGICSIVRPNGYEPPVAGGICCQNGNWIPNGDCCAVSDCPAVPGVTCYVCSSNVCANLTAAQCGALPGDLICCGGYCAQGSPAGDDFCPICTTTSDCCSGCCHFAPNFPSCCDSSGDGTAAQCSGTAAHCHIEFDDPWDFRYPCVCASDADCPGRCTFNPGDVPNAQGMNFCCFPNEEACEFDVHCCSGVCTSGTCAAVVGGSESLSIDECETCGTLPCGIHDLGPCGILECGREYANAVWDDSTNPATCECTPKDFCADGETGQIDDGCGGTISCDVTTTPEPVTTPDPGTTPAPCVPTSCEVVGCGNSADACDGNGPVYCGDCCVPTSCEVVGCGNSADACDGNGPVYCGDCCTPTTCDVVGCGNSADACDGNGPVYCGDCCTPRGGDCVDASECCEGDTCRAGKCRRARG